MNDDASRKILADRTTLEGVTVRLVSSRTLFRMKKDTVRLKDRLDADGLRVTTPGRG